MDLLNYYYSFVDFASGLGAFPTTEVGKIQLYV